MEDVDVAIIARLKAAGSLSTITEYYVDKAAESATLPYCIIQTDPAKPTLAFGTKFFESEFYNFYVYHSSKSSATALGIAIRDQLHQKPFTVTDGNLIGCQYSRMQTKLSAGLLQKTGDIAYYCMVTFKVVVDRTVA